MKNIKNQRTLEKSKNMDITNDDYLIKGKVENFTTISKLLNDYQEVIKITNIAIKDYGSEDMWHFSVTGA